MMLAAAQRSGAGVQRQGAQEERQVQSHAVWWQRCKSMHARRLMLTQAHDCRTA